MDTIARIINPQIKLTCNGEKTHGYYAVVSPAEVLCQLDLISDDEDSPYCPQVMTLQRGFSARQHTAPILSRSGKNTWQFSYKVYTIEMAVERIEMFVAHPALRMMQMFTINVVDEAKKLFSVVRGNIVPRISFVFEDNLQYTGGGFFSSFAYLSQRNTKPFRFYGMQDGKKYIPPEIPYLSITPESYKKHIAGLSGIKVGNSYLFSVTDNGAGLYEANVCARMLLPAIYGIQVYCPSSDRVLGYTRICILSDDEVKNVNRQKREMRGLLTKKFSDSSDSMKE